MSGRQLTILPGSGQTGLWDDLWSRDAWRQNQLPNGDLSSGHRGNRIINFGNLHQPWLKEAAKRFARARILSGSSIGTVASYSSDLVAFSAWLDENHPEVIAPVMLTRELLEDYMLFIRTADMKPATKARRISSLRSLIEEQRDDGLAGVAERVKIHGREVPSVSYSLPKRQIDDTVFQQLIDRENLDRLPIHHQTIMLVLVSTGFRTSSIVTLARNPLTRDDSGHPYLNYVNVKMGREAIIPIPERLAGQLVRHEQWLQLNHPESEYLFPATKRGSQTPHVAHSTVRRVLSAYIKRANIRTAEGDLADFAHPHLFRHHMGTSLVNDGVPLTVIAQMLDHNSLEMTGRYAHIHDRTLREATEGLHTRVNARGEYIAIPTNSALSDAHWQKERIARARQALPNGYCGLPLVQTCPHPNACLSCDSFLTDSTFLSVHKEQKEQTEALLAQHGDSGSVRIVEALQSDLQALTRIIDGLEELDQSNVIDLRDGLKSV